MGYCVLVAGLPASGKTTFAEYLSREMRLPLISKDRLKEILYDTLGFSCREEKVALSIAAGSLLLHYAASLMQADMPFILEDNFENRAIKPLNQLLDTHRYRCVTVRFGGDLKVVYQRYLDRDSKQERHEGHRQAYSYPGRAAQEIRSSMAFDDFVTGIEQRGIARFTLGVAEIVVDTTDFSRVSYEDIVSRIRSELQVGE